VSAQHPRQSNIDQGNIDQGNLGQDNVQGIDQGNIEKCNAQTSGGYASAVSLAAVTPMPS
jgi:hypothetical protein